MRENRLCWDDTHMLSALVIAQRSPDPNTQVGAVLVTSDNRPLGSGYNGTPRGIPPYSIPWQREAPNPIDTKYPYIIHAEKNAIFNTTGPLTGSTLFVTLHPCYECAKDIIQARISQIIYLDNKYKDLWSTQLAVDMFDRVDIPIYQHKWHPNTKTIMQQVSSSL